MVFTVVAFVAYKNRSEIQYFFFFFGFVLIKQQEKKEKKKKRNGTNK